jgi:hypothetical protein
LLKVEENPMNVRELIDILKDYPEDTEVELAIACAVEKDEQIAVDRYPIDGVLPWDDNDEEDGEDAEEKLVIWLVGGEEEDVDAFMDAIEDDADDDEA